VFLLSQFLSDIFLIFKILLFMTRNANNVHKWILEELAPMIISANNDIDDTTTVGIINF
jgi:hypothetical protein